MGSRLYRTTESSALPHASSSRRLHLADRQRDPQQSRMYPFGTRDGRCHSPGVLSGQGAIHLSQVGSVSCRRPASDYPGSYGELRAWFPDDHACIDYLEWLRWPDGFRCPRCVSRAGWRLSSGRWECACVRSDLGDGGNDLSSHADAVADVVRGGMADDQPEAGDLGARAAARARARVLPDSVGDAAPVSLWRWSARVGSG